MALKLSDVKPGDRLVADGGFTCLDSGEVVTVYADEDGCLYVPCHDPEAEDGTHYLCGQLSFDDSGELVGFERAQDDAIANG